jgi:Uma2 family endonuclease
LSGRTYDPGVVAQTEPTSDVHRWSPEEYHRLVESGALDEMRVELIDGYIVDMSPTTAAHDYAIQWLNHAIVARLDVARHQIRVNSSLSLGMSEPMPDIAVVPVDVEAPWHPGSAALAIEVAHSSLRRDLKVKPRVYADAGIRRYWVIDLDRRRAVEHTDPRDGGYGHVTPVAQHGTLAAPELGISFSLAELLAFAIR